MTASIRGLYAVTPDLADTGRLVAMVESALAGGARLVQYRNKIASAAVRAEQARALLVACRLVGVPLIINDHLELAVEIGADGVHLGREDGDIARARAMLPNALLGVSCYNEIERAGQAQRLGADYVAFGRFFASTTKPGAIRASLALVAQARAQVSVPIVGIGGITLQNTSGLISGGIDAVAVVSALFDAQDVCATARAFAALFDRGSN